MGDGNVASNDKWPLRRRVLVVDDDVAIRTLIRGIFEQAGYAVIEARDGAEGYSAATGQNPAIILLDVMMPDVDGFSMCQQIKNSPLSRHIPVIFLTAREQVGDRLEGFRLGADDYVTKPFSPVELVARAETVMNRTSALLDPVTRLPGVESLKDEILHQLDGKIAFSILAFRIERWKDFLSTCGEQKAYEILELLVDVLLKVLSRSGDNQDFLAHFDSETLAIVTLSLRPYQLFDDILEVWKKLRPIQEKKLNAPDLLQLNGVNLQIENLNHNLDTILKKIEGLFVYGSKNGSFVSGATL